MKRDQFFPLPPFSIFNSPFSIIKRRPLLSDKVTPLGGEVVPQTCASLRPERSNLFTQKGEATPQTCASFRLVSYWGRNLLRRNEIPAFAGMKSKGRLLVTGWHFLPTKQSPPVIPAKAGIFPSEGISTRSKEISSPNKETSSPSKETNSPIKESSSTFKEISTPHSVIPAPIAIETGIHKTKVTPQGAEVIPNPWASFRPTGEIPSSNYQLSIFNYSPFPPFQFSIFNFQLLILLLLCFTLNTQAQLSQYKVVQSRRLFNEPFNYSNNSVSIGGSVEYIGYPNGIPISYSNRPILLNGDSILSFSNTLSGIGYPIGFKFEYDLDTFNRFAFSSRNFIKLGKSVNPFSILQDTSLGGNFKLGNDSLKANTISVLCGSFSEFSKYALSLSSYYYLRNSGWPKEGVTTIGFSFYDTLNSSKILDANLMFYENYNAISLSYQNRYPFLSNKKLAVGLRGNSLTYNLSNMLIRKVTKGVNYWDSSDSSSGTHFSDFDSATIHPSPVGDIVMYDFIPPFYQKPVFCSQFYEYSLENRNWSNLLPGSYPFCRWLASSNSTILNPNIGWTPGGQLADSTLRYDFYLDIMNPPNYLFAQNLDTNRISLTNLAPNTKYYVKVVPHNSLGYAQGCNIDSFKTNETALTCEVDSNTNNSYNYQYSFSKILFDSIHFSPRLPNTTPPYENNIYPKQSPYTTSVKKDSTYKVILTYKLLFPPSYYGNNQFTILSADWNNNGNYPELGEIFGIGANALNPNFPVTDTCYLTIPNTAYLGWHKIALFIDGYNIPPPPTPNTFGKRCDLFSKIQVWINVVPQTACQNFKLTPVVTDAPCLGGLGSIALNPTGAHGALSIQWLDDSTNHAATRAVPKGWWYRAVVRDTAGCQAETPVLLVHEPSYPLTLSTSTQDATCFGMNNGKIITQTTHGTASINITTDPPLADLNAVPAGTYLVTATDANGCSASNSVIIAQPSHGVALQATVTKNITCKGGHDGIIYLQTSGNTGTPVYSFSPSIISPNQAMAKTYFITVTDSVGCEAKDTVTLTEPAQALSLHSTIVQNIKCKGNQNGRVLNTVSGGKTPYQIISSPPVSNYNALFAGKYIITATDSNGCVAKDSATLTEPAQALSLHATVLQNIKCKGNATGQVLNTVSGGKTPYQIISSPPVSNYNALPAGKYIITATDSNGCVAKDSATITEPAQALSLHAAVLQNVKCKGNQSGQVLNTVLGGKLPYQIISLPPVSNYNTLFAGKYIITATDSNGCVAKDSATITEPAQALSLHAAVLQNVKCKGNATGQILNTVSGGKTPYQIISLPVATNFNALFAGKYIITATDSNGCVAKDSATITEPAQALSLHLDSMHTSSTAGNGKAIAKPSGGTSPYTFTWNTNPVQTTDTAHNLQSGWYKVTVLDAQHCQVTDSVFVRFYNGISPLSKEETFGLQIYPNPNDGKCTIVLSNAKKAGTLTIYDAAGKKVSDQLMQLGENKFNFHFAAGVYQLHFLIDGVERVEQMVVGN